MLHVAIIMDGNGRWAEQRRLPRTRGHRAGVAALRRVVEAAPALGITDLTVYAFSSDNWQRSAAEVRGIFTLLAAFIRSETARLAESGVRLSFLGRRDRIPESTRRAMLEAEIATAACMRLHLRVAVDYSSRDQMLEAAQSRPRTRDDIERALQTPGVDLLIRSGGEKRLSDFLLWECAYAEFHFTPVLWPDFTAEHLACALADYTARTRRFGAVPAA